MPVKAMLRPILKFQNAMGGKGDVKQTGLVTALGYQSNPIFIPVSIFLLTSADPLCNLLSAFLTVSASSHHSSQHTNVVTISRSLSSPKTSFCPLLVYHLLVLYSLIATLDAKTRPKYSSPCTNTRSIAAPEVTFSDKAREKPFHYQVTYEIFFSA